MQFIAWGVPSLGWLNVLIWRWGFMGLGLASFADAIIRFLAYEFAEIASGGRRGPTISKDV